jgi:16S rRNA (guanine527-N7)-methyltransferase
MAERPADRADLNADLAQGLLGLQLALPRDAERRLLEFLALLQKWNAVYNLTAIRDASSAVSVHLLDSLSVGPYMQGGRILDVGTGGGFPGLPLAIAQPERAFTLLDSNQKKTAFVRQAATELGLKNVTVVCERVEQWQAGEKFNSIVSRAYSSLESFALSCAHLLAEGGVMAAMKGVYPRQEIESLPKQFQVRAVHRLQVPGLEAERHLVMIEPA